MSYKILDEAASAVSPGSNSLIALPFGNGAERMLENKLIGAHFSGLDFNVHKSEHLVRAVQEGVAFSFRYGLDIMKENGIDPKVIRAGRANMFLSKVFKQSFAGATQSVIELYQCDGSVGAAIGAGLGAGFYKNEAEAFGGMNVLEKVEPDNTELYEDLYQQWKAVLEKQLAANPVA